MDRANRKIKLDDGRALGYCEIGDPEGKPLFYFHGFPGSRLEAMLAEKVASEHHVRLISIDRPGYGLSDPKPNRILLDWPDEVNKLANELGIEKFSILGVSGGGPYAAACALKIPQRLINVGIACGLGPIDTPGAEDQMERFNRLGFKFARRAPFLVKPAFAPIALWFRYYPDCVLNHVGHRAGEPDRTLLQNPEFRQILRASFQEAVRSSLMGPARDLILYSRPWGFRLQDIQAKVYLWHGKKDLIVPPSMGDYMAKTIPNCKATFYENEGHFSLIVKHNHEVLTSLTT